MRWLSFSRKRRRWIRRKLSLIAPCSARQLMGLLSNENVNSGQTVAVSLDAKTLFKIANDLREMEVHGKIDEADVGQLKPGQATKFTVDAYPDRTFSGQVLQI